jgi:hypothetical protein
MKQYIEFRKQRELGEIISDTFAFVRNEFKPFIKTVLGISGPYLALFLISFVFYMYTVGDVFKFSFLQDNTMDNYSPAMMFLALLFFATSGILAYVFASSASIHYIKSYIKGNGTIDQAEIKQNVKDTFWSFIGLGILKWIVLIVSVFLCFFPVFYVMVPMTLVFSILVFEKRDATDSFGYSFNLIKDEYWITLVTIIIIGIIVMIASYAFSLPAGIYSIVKMGIFSGEMDPANMMSFTDPVYIILNLFSYFFKFLLNLISLIAGVFIYFNLNERKNFTGTYEKIKRLGNTDS